MKGLKAMKNIINCLEFRLKWYEKSIDMMCGRIPMENGFDFPTSTNNPKQDATAICEWRGAAREIKNTLDMIEHELEM